jgi:hypothetical protein
MEFILDEKKVNQFNVFYYGENNSHCGSCWESSDEEVYVLISTMSLDELGIKMKDYLERKKSSLERFTYPSFLEWVCSDSVLYEEEDDTPVVAHICMYFTQEGRSYAPSFDSHYNPLMSYNEYDISEKLIPSEVLDSEFWEECLKTFSDKKDKRLAQEKELEELEEKTWTKVRKYSDDLEEYKKLLAMKRKVGGTKKISRPKKPDVKEYLIKTPDTVVSFPKSFYRSPNLNQKIKELGLIPKDFDRKEERVNYLVGKMRAGVQPLKLWVKDGE